MTEWLVYLEALTEYIEVGRHGQRSSFLGWVDPIDIIFDWLAVKADLLKLRERLFGRPCLEYPSLWTIIR